MLFGYFTFALNDALGKHLVASFGVAQIVAIRSVGGFAMLGAMLYRRRENPFHNVYRPGLQVLRAIFATLDTGLFYAACVFLPLADVFTFYMAGPIYTLVAARFLLGERIGWRRWAAIAVGFVGVLIALKPSTASLSVPALFALGGSVCYSLALVFNRLLARASDTSIGTFQTIGALAGGGVFAFFDWRPLTTGGVAAMLLLGVIATMAHLLVIRAMKLAPVAILAPFQYTLLLWGIVMGAVFFGDLPEANVIVGSVIIVLAGLFIFYRERQHAPAVSTSELTANNP
jgi:S-adenosylmethionine uptake transporter